MIAADEQIAGTGLAEDADRTSATFFHVWATHEMPVDLSDEAGPSTRGQLDHDPRVGCGLGAADRRASPGHPVADAPDESLDYGICLEGECDMELDGGETVTVRAGDVIVQRGTNHLWHNRGDVACRFAWVLLDAQPVEVEGRPLGASWRHDA